MDQNPCSVLFYWLIKIYAVSFIVIRGFSSRGKISPLSNPHAGSNNLGFVHASSLQFSYEKIAKHCTREK